MRDDNDDNDDHEPEAPLEIAFTGDLTDNEDELTNKLLEVPLQGECTIYFDSPGGSPYTALSLMMLLSLRGIDATAVVTGECSSAALWPFAACRRRLVTRWSMFLFHPIKWQSEEQVQLTEAAEWARHFRQLESSMDERLAEALPMQLDVLTSWMNPGRYLTGVEIAEAGLAELIELSPLPHLQRRAD